MLIILALTRHCSDGVVIYIARGLESGGCMMGEETSASWHSMSEDKLFSDHKETLLPIKAKVCFLAILESFV